MKSKVSWLALLLCVVTLPASAQRWSEAQANDWYSHEPWLVGANYIPADAINELEMWQEPTFNPKEIDRELGWAQSVGMNTMRVFLQDLLWKDDPAAFKHRMDEFLTIADRHHIRPVFVLFDSCWEAVPKLGPQHPPIPGVHNSGWVQSPGQPALKDPKQYPRLQAYVEGVVGAFANDKRVLAWDVWNEPADSPEVLAMLPKAFTWARAAHPTQPLTSGMFDDEFATKLTPVAKIQLDKSDVLSFHNYSWPEKFEQEITWLQQYHRPIFCTEYMARSAGSTFDGILPIAKKYKVAAINWGLVNGKTQTDLPWDSWDHPYTQKPPTVWFHDVFHADGTPYRLREAQLLRELTGTPTP